MGRLPLSGSKMRKIKFGTTVQATTPEKIEELRLKNPESVRSTGEAIDYLCNLLTGLQPRVARALDEACLREARQITNEMKALPVDGSEEMSFSQLELYREQFQRLHDHFSLYCEKEERPQGMRRVDLLGGDYAVLLDFIGNRGMREVLQPGRNYRNSRRRKIRCASFCLLP